MQGKFNTSSPKDTSRMGVFETNIQKDYVHLWSVLLIQMIDLNQRFDSYIHSTFLFLPKG